MQVNNNSNLTHKLNHMPQQIGSWFAYTGFRYKDNYDIELHDGTVHTKMYPNANSFNAMDGSGVVVKDEDVAFLRLTPDEDLDSGFDFTGDDRIARNVDMFADIIERDNPSGAPFMISKPDLTKLKETLDKTQTEIVASQYNDEDNDHYIWESTMEAFYGKGYFDWFNKYVK